MNKRYKLTHQFVEFIPDQIEEGALYVSVQYATAVHKCCCGCGREVVTPITPTDWTLQFDGETVSLDPSIGNWSFHCRSHYWIKRNAIRWAVAWSDGRIHEGRLSDAERKAQYYSSESIRTGTSGSQPAATPRKQVGFWEWVRRALGRS